ncbi:galactitol-1-phosphate 5-dehydrogenase [Candidatus Poribacteria bacterium]|nr:galactitol-1-phosphate 5-dehydrogenase [Candidatus Poribacteria bacterium]
MHNGLMEALVLHGVGDLRLSQMPIPNVSEGQVRVRIGFCGVCGSDIPRIFSKGTYSFPTVCGHEFAGTIDLCGPDVDGFEQGDSVVVFPLIWCGKCDACENGKYVQCSAYDYLGSRSDGAFAEYVVAPKENLIRVPNGVTLQEAALTEPAAVALHALRRVQDSLVGKTVAIFGAGPIGLIVAQWARIIGAMQVLLFDIFTEKLKLAQRLGFESVFNSTIEDPIDVVNAQTKAKGAHVCIEAAGVPQTYLYAFGSVQRGGSVVLLGNPVADVTLPASLISQLMRREVSLLGTWNSDYSVSGNDDDWRTVLQAIASGKLDLSPLITHKVPLTDSTKTLHMMKDKSEFYAKVLIHPS